MSARKIDSSVAFQPVLVESRQTRLTLSPDEVRIRRNGVEFFSDSPINVWTEMTVSLQSTRDAGKVNCTGVVVACNGNRHQGFTVSMVFTKSFETIPGPFNLLAYS